jgi:carbon storage regulator
MMLVLSRKSGESIRLGDDIEVTVCQISGHRVRLAISAPRHVSIRRSELDVRSPRPSDRRAPNRDEAMSTQFIEVDASDLLLVPSV